MGIKSFSRARAIHVMLVYTGGCNGCDIEIVNSILSPRFDAEQYNVFLTWNPREADVLVVTGPVTHLNRKPLEEIYKAIPNPKLVVAAGSCALMGEYTKTVTVIFHQKKLKDRSKILYLLMQKFRDVL